MKVTLVAFTIVLTGFQVDVSPFFAVLRSEKRGFNRLGQEFRDLPERRRGEGLGAWWRPVFVALRSLVVASGLVRVESKILAMNSARITIIGFILCGGGVNGQGLLRTLDYFSEDFAGVVPLVPEIKGERVSFSCFRASKGLLANYSVRYAFLKARQERDMPCVAIVVDIPSGNDRGKEVVRRGLLKHAREVWGAAIVELGGFGVPGKTTHEYGRKGSKVTNFRIIEEELKRLGLPNLTRLTVEAATYKASQYNKARIK